MKYTEKGVTLVALTVTIIVLAILVGISLNVVVGDNGLINRAKKVSDDADQVKAKEKLQLELANLSGDKISDKSYDEQEYIDNRLISKDMKVYEDYVVVDGWLFEIDRSEPKIKNDLGQGTINENIQVVAEKTISGDYGEANIIARVIYNKGTIKTIKIGGEEISFNNNGAGKFEGSKKVTSNGTYNIIAIDIKGNLQFGNITITELTSDLEIYTMEDMNKFKADLRAGKTYAGKNVKLMSDLDLGLSETDSWEPIEGFKGTFYGNDYKIKNLYINDTAGKGNQGLFGTIDEKAQIKDLILESGKVISAGSNVGALSGKSFGIVDGVENKIEISGASAVGGIVGFTENGTIINCINSGKIVCSGDFAAGIVGRIENGNLNSCNNSGDVTSGTRVGGIIGYSDNLNGNVFLCWNSGNITGNMVDSSNYTYVGGIAGALLFNTTGEWSIFDCFNQGNLYGKGGPLGGVVGNLGSNSSTIRSGGKNNCRCYNSGSLTAPGNLVGEFAGVGYRGLVSQIIGLGNVRKAMGSNGYGFTSRNFYSATKIDELDWENILGSLFSMETSPDGKCPGLINR